MKVREGRERERDGIKLSSCAYAMQPSESGENGVETDGERRSGLGLGVADTSLSVCGQGRCRARVPHAFIQTRVRSAHAQDRVSCGEAAQLSIMFLLPSKVKLCEAASHGLVTDSNDSHSEDPPW